MVVAVPAVAPPSVQDRVPLRRLGFPGLAEEASRELPDTVDMEQITTWSLQHGVSKDDVISHMGGSP